MTVVLMILVVSALIFINALYVAGEFSTVSARRPRIQTLAAEGNRLARLVLPVISDPHKLDSYIAASQVGITVSSIVLGIYGEQQIAPLVAPLLTGLPFGITTATAAATSTVLVLVVLTSLQVLFGELLPKSLGLQYPERMALATAVPMTWSANFLLKPLIVLLNGSGRFLLRLLGAEEHSEHQHVHSPEEIVILVQESHRGGLIDADERQMLRNVFRAGDASAGEIAVPRNRLLALEVDTPLREALERAAGSAYSRIPVFRETIDHIIGFVHLRDLFMLYRQDPDAPLEGLVRAAPYVPESLPAIRVWQRLDESNSYLAVVLDEYGGTAGLLTREDLIEELFGELQDEFDQEAELIQNIGPGQYRARGDYLIEHLNDRFGLGLPHNGQHTLAGLLQAELGRIPVEGDTITLGSVTLQAESVSGAVVESVCLSLPVETGGENAESEAP